MAQKMLNPSHRNLIVIDVETSGINPFLHEVIAIGLVPLDDELPKLTVYIRHEKIEWTEYAHQNFNKFACEWNYQAVPPQVACIEIENYLCRTFDGQLATAIGHNVGFDLSFLKRLAFQGARDQIKGLSHRAIDTHTLLYLLNLDRKIPETAITSDGALEFFSVDVEESARHTALGDAEATSKLFKRILEKIDSDH